MGRPPAAVQKRLGIASLGVFDANAWIEEGDGLLSSARSIRARWLRMKRQIKARKSAPRHGEWRALTGNPRASVLLLGYAVEMYLKAGLAKWLRHCPEYLLLGETKYYSHDYKLLADDLEIDEATAPRALLEFLSKAVTLEARYPAIAEGSETAIDAINRRTSNMWGTERFKELCRLAKRLRAHVQRMNGDERNPSSTQGFDVAGGGYLVFRIGGHLPSRITARPPNGQSWDVNDLTQLLESIESFEIKRFWKVCALYLDDGRRSKLVRASPEAV